MKNFKTLFLCALLFTGYTVTAQIPEKAENISPLLIGEKIPSAKLTAGDGRQYDLSILLSEKPSVLLIYRGGWCPYCNSHLSDIQEAEKDILELGYQIIAVSPDSPENLSGSLEKEKLNYLLLSDADGSLIKEMGLAFTAPQRYGGMLLKASGGLNNGFLPVPAAFVVDIKGVIQFEHINPDYSTRISSNLLLAVLKALQE